MPLIKHPLRAYRNAREAFRVFNQARKGRKLRKEIGIMLEGKKTYIGIATVVLGLVLSWLGIGQCDPGAADCQSAESFAAQIVDNAGQLITLLGAAFAAYGRAKAKPQ